jgi:levanase/fructan beta-fructosidase
MAIPATESYGEAWSGSAVVDRDNRLGLQGGKDKTLAVFFTGEKTWGQYLSVSTDMGRTWRLFRDEPVIPMIMPGNRDPKVFFHDESGKWVMALWCRHPDNTGDREDPAGLYLFFNSDNLVEWERQSSIRPFYECPDLFKLPVDGTDDYRWVLVNGNGDHMIGHFDGKAFVPGTTLLKGDYGNNFYATQTWNHLPGGRIVQMAWMRNTGAEGSRYPGMPFDQQMIFPRELSLRMTPDGVRMFRNPVKEIEGLYSGGQDATCCDIELEAPEAPGTAVISRGGTILCEVSSDTVSAFGKKVPVSSGEVVRLLVDRVSVEIFIGEGRATMSFCYLPVDHGKPAVEVSGKVSRFRMLRSIWD